MYAMIAGLVGKVVSSWQERKAKEVEAKAAWESAAGRSMENGWKDEYITVVVTFPLWQIFIGNILAAWTGNSAIIEASDASLESIGVLLQTPYGELMTIVVLAAVGIKGIKSLR